jgi:DNA-binding MarR family transcriptional regulator
MSSELSELIDLFLKMLHLYSVIGRKPKDYGTGCPLYFAEIHTITVIGRNDDVNMTRLAGIMGVTKGAISQTIRKLVSKNLILKTNINNRREVNLKLSETGRRVLEAQESFQQEIFTFASVLYEKARPDERETVRRLFLSITENMENRVRNL